MKNFSWVVFIFGLILSIMILGVSRNIIGSFIMLGVSTMTSYWVSEYDEK